jgi:hypothetical protein
VNFPDNLDERNAEARIDGHTSEIILQMVAKIVCR